MIRHTDYTNSITITITITPSLPPPSLAWHPAHSKSNLAQISHIADASIALSRI